MLEAPRSAWLRLLDGIRHYERTVTQGNPESGGLGSQALHCLVWLTNVHGQAAVVKVQIVDPPNGALWQFVRWLMKTSKIENVVRVGGFVSK